MNSSQSGTHLGNYLRETRLSRGYTNVNEYLRKYQLPISYVYYRDIEIGKRKIGLESARVLCEALHVDYRVFYSHLLKDLLPAEVMDSFIHQIPQAGTDSDKTQVQTGDHKNILSETKKSIKQLNESLDEELADPSLFHGVTALTESSRQKVLNRVADLLAEISAAQEGDPPKGAKPYFYSLILAARPEYRRPRKKTNQKMGKTVP
ncbi:MAG: hypothetical protein K2X29_00395 [Candidatus Obscuribacterales bacterium]|nr:hypothetical protein [Candidatus Obscuribacterales bacterium]